MSEELISNDRAMQFNSGAVAQIIFSLWVQKYFSTPGFEPWTPNPHQNHCPLAYQSLLDARLQSILFQQQALLQSESNRDNSKLKNESVKKSLEKSKNAPEENRKSGQAKNLH